MIGLWVTLAFIIGALFGAVAAYYRTKSALGETHENDDAQLEKIMQLRESLAAKEQEVISLQKRREEDVEKAKEQKQVMLTEFENLANKVLEQKSKKFTEQNKENIGHVLNPLKERLEKFEKAVQDTNKEHLGRHSALKEQITQLSELNKQMSQDAQNLVKALKGESKTRGNWGELVLEKILEGSGLVKGREYSVQQSYTADDGKRLQPDVIVNLPDNKKLIIDSKLSLIDYEKSVSDETDDRQEYLKRFIQSVRAHIKSLSDKDYHSLYEIDSLDFVLMFIPIEPAFSLALQADEDMYRFAYEKNIIIVSPSTLLATLRTIANIWKHEYQNQNVLEIADEAGKLYDKFVGFTEDLIKVGNSLESTQRVYKDSMNKLTEGKGNLVRRAEKIRELGAKTGKNINQNLLRRSENNDQEQLDK